MMSEEMNALGYPMLKPKSPIPSDIEISQSIVKEVGLLPIPEVAKQYVVVAFECLFDVCSFLTSNAFFPCTELD